MNDSNMLPPKCRECARSKISHPHGPFVFSNFMRSPPVPHPDFLRTYKTMLLNFARFFGPARRDPAMFREGIK